MVENWDEASDFISFFIFAWQDYSLFSVQCFVLFVSNPTLILRELQDDHFPRCSPFWLRKRSRLDIWLVKHFLYLPLTVEAPGSVSSVPDRGVLRCQSLLSRFGEA